MNEDYKGPGQRDRGGFRGETGRISGDIMEFLVSHSWGTSGVAWGHTALQKVHSGCRVEEKMEEI